MIKYIHSRTKSRSRSDNTQDSSKYSQYVRLRRRILSWPQQALREKEKTRTALNQSLNWRTSLTHDNAGSQSFTRRCPRYPLQRNRHAQSAERRHGSHHYDRHDFHIECRQTTLGEQTIERWWRHWVNHSYDHVKQDLESRHWWYAESLAEQVYAVIEEEYWNYRDWSRKSCDTKCHPLHDWQAAIRRSRRQGSSWE